MEEDKVEGVVVVEEAKRSLCRFYVRGLCMLRREECHFSHGINDLDYRPWAGEAVEEDYLGNTAFCQKKAVKGPRVYINLYEFQPVKKYSLEQLNSERPLRVEVRAEMHRRLFHDFIELLQRSHPGANLTEEVLVREYTRAGFNKLMTRIKFAHLAAYLCDAEGSRYFRRTCVMPPCLKRETTFLFRRAPEQETLDVYRGEYARLVKEAQGPLDEAVLKKRLFQAPVPHLGIPPLATVLKEKRLSFAEFLEVLGGAEGAVERVRLEARPEEMLEAACAFLDKEGAARVVGWGELYQQLSRRFKVNNGNVLNQVKPLLVLRGYRFLNFPTVQFIHHHSFAFDFSTEMLSNCSCQLRDKFPPSEMTAFEGQGQPVKEGDSVDIDSLESLLRFGPLVLRSKVLGVDLEGSLRRGGFVEMVQLNNGANTFLFDIFAMEQQGAHEAVALTKKLLRNVMVDGDILKIFHDCRHDSLALHLFLQTCITNVFDTSAAESALMQLRAYGELAAVPEQQRQARARSVLLQGSKVKTLGLNEILRRYNASHGINGHKERFHRMWSQGEVAFFCKRPMDPDYREYCIKDVLDLPEVYEKIAGQHPREVIDLCQWLSSSYVRQGQRSSREGEKQ